MVLHVRQGKGAKDRYVPLPKSTYHLLRRYWCTHRNPQLIFPAVGRTRNQGPISTIPMSIEGVQGGFRRAKIAAGILNVALTKRHTVPMCGVPHHAAQGYIAKLIKAGKRVAIAEQTSVPVPGQLVDREISQILSAGTNDYLNLSHEAKQT